MKAKQHIVITVMVGILFALSACSIGSFDIRGTWKSTGESGWGQAQPASIVQFNNGKANLYSPQDTYAFYKDGDTYKLDLTGLLGDSVSFRVEVINDDKIELWSGSTSLSAVLERVG